MRHATSIITQTMVQRRYTGGQYDFKTIVEDGAVISDKTGLMYDLVKNNTFVFLSRPRRFGKSLLCSMLKYYFLGKKELFKGFAIEHLEKDWKQYPVLTFSMSSFKNENAEGVRRALMSKLKAYGETYGCKDDELSPGLLFSGIIRRAAAGGTKVVLIIDEYDAPMLDTERSDEDETAVRRVMLDFYQQIKECTGYIQFAFLTGITKFSNLSIFSAINNLCNISMLGRYSTICGITQSEMETTFKPDVENLAEYYEVSYDEMLAILKEHYDGYRFAKRQPEEIYNPYSLTNAFKVCEISNFWFESGTPSYLIPFLKKFKTEVTGLNDMCVNESDFHVSLDSMTTALPLLFQSGYLTIKGYDSISENYTLGFPNSEVRSGFMNCVLKELLGVGVSSQGIAGNFYASLYRERIDDAMQYLRAYFASIPYPQQGVSSLDDFARFEDYYQTLLYVVFSIFSSKIHTEVRSARGRADVVFSMPDTQYVMEVKLCKTNAESEKAAEEALSQIDDKGYAIPYEKPGKRVVKIGVAFSQESRTVEEYLIQEA
ncbi:MAG: AAA family ATPase [Bacteroidales bacterium]|nr:AAA family ATPase [Candidatus Colimorpha onthohippi]